MSFSKYLKELRTQKGLTQQELAESLNISLPNIKTIEAGKTSLPSMKLLESIALYQNETQGEVLKEIIFNEPSELIRTMPLHLQYYIAWQYVKGYTFDLFPEYYCHSEYVGNKQYICLLTKKREAQVKIMIDDLLDTNYNVVTDILENKEELRNVLIEKLVILGNMEELPKIREYRFILDANHKLHLEVFNAYKQVPMEFVKDTMTMQLYDYKTNEIVQEHTFSGNAYYD